MKALELSIPQEFQPTYLQAKPARNKLSLIKVSHLISCNKIDYQSTGGSKKSQDQLFTQIEEVIKSMTEHLSNMTKSIILEEDSSFVQDSLSKKFTESLTKKDYHFT